MITTQQQQQFSETVEDISISLTLGPHCNLQFSVAASSRRICDVFSVNLRLQFPFNNNNNNNNNTTRPPPRAPLDHI